MFHNPFDVKILSDLNLNFNNLSEILSVRDFVS